MPKARRAPTREGATACSWPGLLPADARSHPGARLGQRPGPQVLSGKGTGKGGPPGGEGRRSQEEEERRKRREAETGLDGERRRENTATKAEESSPVRLRTARERGEGGGSLGRPGGGSGAGPSSGQSITERCRATEPGTERRERRRKRERERVRK